MKRWPRLCLRCTERGNARARAATWSRNASSTYHLPGGPMAVSRNFC